MARARPLRFSQRKHPLWLLVALAVGVLVGLTSPGAHARPVAVLLHALARDLGALRVQLEQVAARPPETGASSIAFAADLGDGGHGFHRAAMLATLRTAHRSAASLDRRYRETGDPVRLDTVEKLVLRLYDMERWLVAIGARPTPQHCSSPRRAPRPRCAISTRCWRRCAAAARRR